MRYFFGILGLVAGWYAGSLMGAENPQWFLSPEWAMGNHTIFGGFAAVVAVICAAVALVAADGEGWSAGWKARQKSWPR